LQLYAQLFSAGIHDGDPLRAPAVAGQRAISTVGLEAARPEDAATPTAVRQAALDVNLILRWEWRRGSAFYVVYAHQSSGARAPDPASGLSLGDELGTLSSAGNLDSLLVKIDVLSAL